MKKILFSLLLFFTLLVSGCQNIITNNNTTITTQKPTTTIIKEFEDYGMEVIEIDLDDYIVTITGIYNTVEKVVIYIYLYDKLPSNFRP